MAATAFIDGVEVTDSVLEGSATRRLNRPAQATIRMPIDLAIGDVGSRLKVYFDGTLFFHGTILMIEDEADEDFGYTTYNASDPFELWQWRPVRDFSTDPGNLIDPPFIRQDATKTGPQMIQEIMVASENPFESPAYGRAEGTLNCMYGDFEINGSDLRGAPVSWPMTMAEFTNLLTSTGSLDVVFRPIDIGNAMAEVSAYNGDYGTNLSGSVSYDYGTGNYNVRAIRQSVDMSTMVNKLIYEIGPKQTTRKYRGNITGYRPYPQYPLGSVDPNCFKDEENGKWTHAQVLATRAASIGTYGVRMEIQEFDTDEWVVENPPDDCNDPARIFLRRQWQLETWIRAQPRRLVHVTPIRGVNSGVGSFDIGDIIGVSAGAFFRGGFSGAQRVYEYTVSWDENGVYELSEIQTSADQDA